MRALIAAVFLLMAQPAQAGIEEMPDEVLLRLLNKVPADLRIHGQEGTFQDQRGEYWNVTIPPLRWFDTKPRPELIFVMPQTKVIKECGVINGRLEDWGCALIWTHRCEIWITEELPKEAREHVQWHEIAHCRGWPATHPLD